MPDAREDEDLIIDLNALDEPDKGDKDADDKSEAKVAAPVKSEVIEPVAGLEELQKQIETDRAERDRITTENRRLQGERDQAMALAQEAERRGVSTQEVLNDTQQKGINDQIESLQTQQEAAYQDSDFKKVAEINGKLNKLGGQLAMLEEKKLYLEDQRKNPPQLRERREPPSGDPIDDAINKFGSEPTKQFLRKHRELLRGDGSLKRIAIDAHEKALDDGFSPDTEPYFAHIEKILAGGKAPQPQEQPERKEPVQGAPTIAAPVGRTPTEGAMNGGASTFKMTPKMRRLAEEQNVSPGEWAKNYVRLLAEGKISPVT